MAATIHVNARAIIERDSQSGPEIVLQTRAKPGERAALELPGGRIEPYESMYDALRREVFEETGLKVVAVDGEGTRIVGCGEFVVESLRPFAAYQTLEGPADSFGVYFRCRAEGTLLANGDATAAPGWHSLARIAEMLRDEPRAFTDIDRAGILLYLKERTEREHR